MLSEENTSPQPLTDAREQQVRNRRTPKHLDDYILAYHPHRPAPSSYAEDEEQTGAVAAVGGGQADAGFPFRISKASYSPSSGDPLSTTSLKQLMDSISRSEDEERAEIAQVTNKLRQYEDRQRRRKELLKHIAFFLQEEEGDSSVKSTTSFPVKSQLSSYLPSHVPPYSRSSSAGKEHSYTGRHTSAEVIATWERETEQREPSPETEVKGTNSAFTPVHPASPEHFIPCYSIPSSSLMFSTSAPPQPVKPLPLRTQRIGLYSAEGEPINQHSPQAQQVTTTAPPYKTTASPQRGQTASSYSPPQSPLLMSLPHAPMSSAATTPQLLPFAPAVTSPTPTEPSLPYGPPQYAPMSPHVVPFVPRVTPSTVQSQLLHNIHSQSRSIYGVPKPKIPDFTTDSEMEFANLKLALDNLLEPYPELTEKYKYHVLLEHLKFPEAQMIGQSCRHDPFPYTAAMHALQVQYGQPHQLAQSEIAAILTMPDVRSGDARTFQSFSLRVHLLVSMLLSLEGPQGMEINCCSHVDRLLSKLPKYHRDGFIEYLQLQGKLNTTSLNPYNLQDLNGWLQGKAQQQRLSNRLVQRY